MEIANVLRYKQVHFYCKKVQLEGLSINGWKKRDSKTSNIVQ